MAGSGDECDLDTLSALLEEDSEDGLSIQAAAAEEWRAVKENTESLAEERLNDSLEEEEMDMDALTSMLDQDSDLENAGSQEEQKEVTADDIAAFFNETSDSENDEETEDGSKESQGHLESTGGFEPADNSSVTGGPDSVRHGSPQAGSTSNNDNDTQQDSQDVKHLQDELAMMQQRMMEIQQMLASQTSSTAAATAPQTVTLRSGSPKRTKQTAGSPKATASSSASAAVSSTHSSNKTSTSSSKKVKSFSPALAQPEKKPSSKYSHSAKRTATGKTPASKTSYLATNTSAENSKTSTSKSAHVVTPNGSSASFRLHTSSGKTPRVSPQTAGVKTFDSTSQQITGTRKDHAPTTNNLEPKSAVKNEGGQESLQLGSSSSKKKRTPSSMFLVDVAEKQGEVSHDRDLLKRSLFGEDDSNSDWEDEDADKTKLSNGGQEIKRLVQGQRQRQAHTPSYTLPSTPAATWKSKVSVSALPGATSSGNPCRPLTSAGSSASLLKKEPDTKDYSTEKFSGLRIMNPKVSSIMLASKMEGRRLIPVSKLHLKKGSTELQSDWVTIGVVVHKSEARKSQTGKTYSIWKLSDLQDTDRTVSFFLFGQVYKQLWKMDVGTVIGLLNPNIMDSMEKGGGDVAFTVNNAQQVMEIGQSKDLGWCVSKTKRGAPCTNVINKKLGDFCTYHVQAAYRKQSAKRSELHGSCPGTTPKSSLKSKILQNNTFFYGGECFTASQGKGKGGGKKDKVTLSKLQTALTQQEQRKVNTLAIQNLLPTHNARVQTSLTSQHQRPFLDMLSVPTVGSMNLVRHIAKAEEKSQDVKKVAKGEPITTFQSIHASDLLKQHRQDVAERLRSRKQQLKSTSPQQNSHPPQSRNSKQTLAKSPASSSSESSEQPHPKSLGHPRSKASGQLHCKSPGQSHSKGSPLSDPSCSETGRQDQASAKSGEGSSNCANPSRNDGGAGKPMLGKGFYPGRKIDLFAESATCSQRKPTSTDLAKRKAIQKVNAIGGLEKKDPNALRPTTQNADKIRKRVLENIENEQKVPESREGGDDGSGAEPARKKSRLLGNVDPNSEEVKQLLTARSSHTGALAQAEAEREERYFDGLEKKEMMEEKMKTVTSMEVSVVSCEQCKYTAMSQSDRCKQERHAVRRHKGKRRFFACKKCQHRTVSLHRYPTTPCTKCGEHSYEKTSMHQEKTGPKLESEILSLRGDESKFISAMEQKVFLSTVVQD